MKEDRLVSLVVRYWSGELSPEETQELDKWAGEAQENRELLNKVSWEEDLKKELNAWNQIDPVHAYEKWSLWQQTRRKARIFRMVRWSVAAASIVAISIVGVVHYYGIRSKREPQVVAVRMKRDLPPGSNRAILTLANGSRVVLDSVNNGTIARQGNIVVQKQEGGVITYRGAAAKAGKIVYNEISTPAGGQYPVVLQDGTKVWLNAVSSIRFPAAFTGKERRVEITGEAYFEVAHDRFRPFHVIVNEMDIEVLGTRFDVNAYADEPLIKTTLLEGKVRVSKGSMNDILLPMEQAQLSSTGHLVIAKDVDAEGTIAWKNGYFQFNGADIQTVMRQLARWYNVKIMYEGEIPSVLSSGSISRDNMISVVLQVLQAGGIRFRIEGDTIIVMS